MSTAGIVNLAAEPPRAVEAVEGKIPRHVARHLVSSASTLGASVAIERGLGFLANILAARFGGTSVFGAYSLGLSTANNISTYAAGGIGSTAVRFSGKYARGSSGYITLAKVLSLVTLASAALAVAGLWAGAAPIAHLLQKNSLTGLLRWAALSAAGMIVLESCRGFLVGQRRFAALLLLSLSVGIGMLTLLPLAARVSPVHMIWSQGAVTLGAVALCLFLYRPLGLAAPDSTVAAEPFAPMLKSVWSFGSIQLAGLVGSNAAGWWLTTLVARSDNTMVQMGFLAVASQLRNLVGLAPSLLTESSLAVMAQREDDVAKTPDQVMAVCTFATTFAALALAGFGILIVPWALTLLYGHAYTGAAAVSALALATAVVHMGNSPAAARLSLVSIRATGLINTQWAILVALSATLFLFHGGNAWKGAGIYLLAHIASAILVLATLLRHRCVPSGMLPVFAIGTGVSLALAAFSVLRSFQPGHFAGFTLAIAALYLAGLAALLVAGKRYRWVPSLAFVGDMLKVKRFTGVRPVEDLESEGING